MRLLALFIVIFIADTGLLYGQKKEPAVAIKSISFSGKPDFFRKGDAKDNGIRKFKIELTLSGKPAGPYLFKIKIPDNNLSTKPKLVNETLVIKKEDFDKKTITVEDSIQLTAVDCLLADEEFEIVPAVVAKGKSNGTSDKLTISKFVPAAPVITLAEDTSVIKAYLKSAKNDNGDRVVLFPFVLSGINKRDTSLTMKIPAHIKSRSAPSFVNGETITIPQKLFPENGCPKTISVPVLMRLNAVDSLHQDEVIPILTSASDSLAYTLIIRQDKEKRQVSNNIGIAKDDSAVCAFTYACAGNNFFVEIRNESSGRIISIKWDTLRQAQIYHTGRKFNPDDFARWFLNIYGDKLRNEPCDDCVCIIYLTERINKELEALAEPAKPKTETMAAKNEGQNAGDAKKAETPGGAAKEKSNPAIHLDNKETAVNPLYNKKDSSQTDWITMAVIRDSLPDKNDTLKLITEKRLFPYKPEIISSQPLILKKDQWKSNDSKITGDTSGKSKKVYQNVRVRIDKPSTDSLANDAVGYIRIENGDESFHAIRLTEKGLYKSHPFWMETGSNFDLLDGIKAQNLYAGIYMFEKDIASVIKRNNLSFTGGVYESKSSSFAATSDSGIVYRDATSFRSDSTLPFPRQGYRYYRDTGSVVTTTNVQSIGIFFSPHLRLTRTKTEENGFHAFFSIYLEMLWQRVESKFDYAKTGRDSVYYATWEQTRTLPFRESSLSHDFRSQYIGVGIPFYITEKSFSLYINNVFGWNNQKFSPITEDSAVSEKFESPKNLTWMNNTFRNTTKPWNPFFLLQFRLTEETYGVVFTGDIRGFLRKGAKPVISLALSKKFDLGELISAVVKPFVPGNR